MGRSLCANAGAAVRSSDRIVMRQRTDPIVLAGRRGDQKKSLANDSCQLGRGLELRRASARDVHRLSRAWILALARLPSTDGKGSKSHQGDGLAALERGTDRCKHCAERAVGGGLGPAALCGHGGDQIRASHAKRRDVVISSGRMLAEAPERVKAAAIPMLEIRELAADEDTVR